MTAIFSYNSVCIGDNAPVLVPRWGFFGDSQFTGVVQVSLLLLQLCVTFTVIGEM